jgi:predicted nucleic acid-binding protein
MIVIVDSNIFFSALISPAKKIAEIIADPSSRVKLISCHYAFIELFKHQPKIIKYANRPQEETLAILYQLLQHVEFYSQTLIEESHWQEADRLTIGVDSFDMCYVALALQMGGWLWTGDKKLSAHLQSMGFNRLINTVELYDHLEIG